MTDFPSVTAYLSWDHDRLDALLAQAFDHVVRGDLAGAMPAFGELSDGLVRHMRLEEELLFPVFEQRTGIVSGPTEVMRTEHRALERALARMREALVAKDKDGATRSHDDLVEVLVAHHMKEEEVLYPLTDRTLGATDREELAKKLVES